MKGWGRWARWGLLALMCVSPATARAEAAEGPRVRETSAQGGRVISEARGSRLALPIQDPCSLPWQETVALEFGETPDPAASIAGVTQEARNSDRRSARRRASSVPATFTAERARILLRSLTVPGWGQATIGRRTSAGVFALAELGVWASFTAFRIQQQMRRETYERTARLLAGIDLRGRDEEFRRIVGSFLSSEQYNLLVVFRDAANQFYDDPVRYREYIAEHQLAGSNAWDWGDEVNLVRYRGERKRAQRAGLRANTALALAILNRLVSAVHAARAAGYPQSEEERSGSWNLEVLPGDPDDATALRLAVRTRF